MHLSLTARAKGAVGFDRDMDAGKMRRQRARIDPPLVVLVRRPVGGAVLLPLVVMSRSASEVSISSSASCI
jgi:hypothetical protein